MKLEVSERQQVVIIILLAGVVLFSLWFFMLAPLNMRRHRLEKEIGAMTDRLARDNYLLGEDPLRKAKLAEEDLNRELHDCWSQLAERLEAFPDTDQTTNATIEHIDFKVALFDVESSLHNKARNLGIKMPGDLGLDGTLRSNEDARTRMLQLRAEEKLLDLVLDLKIGTIGLVEPLAPVLHKSGDGTVVYLEEYPVLVSLQCSADNARILLRAVKAREHALVFRHWRLQRIPFESPDRLELTAVVSALAFVKDEKDIVPVVPQSGPVSPAAPMGF